MPSDAVNRSSFHALFCLALPGRGLDLSKQKHCCWSSKNWFHQRKKSWLFLTPTGSTVLRRMLRPLLTHLYLLRLDVSVCIILVTLNVSLTGTSFSHVTQTWTMEYFLFLFYNLVTGICVKQQRQQTQTLTCLVFAVPKFLIYMSYSLTGGRSKRENVVEKSRSIKRRRSVPRFL